MYDLIVIGGGPAGTTAALRARELGASVALVERGRMGGVCTNDGCVPTRVLAKAARLKRDTQQLEAYGMDAHQPEVDFERLMARTQHVVNRLHEKKQLLGHLQAAGVAVWPEVGEARFVDPHTLALPDGRKLQASRFIICAGGHARRLGFPGQEFALTHSDVWTLKAVPRSVVVVGAAATGCQLASVFETFGAETWLLDTAPRILPGEDELTSQVMAHAFQRNGIRILTGIRGVRHIEKRKDLLWLACSREAEDMVIVAETVVLAVGWPGNADGLNLSAAGVESRNGYIRVDDDLRTTVAHIFAAGDITGRMMLVQTANHDALIAAENAVLGSSRAAGRRVVPHGGFTDPEYAGVGLNSAEARARLGAEAFAEAVVPYADLDRAVIDGHTEGFFKLLVARETGEVLGAHCVGEQAVEVVQLAATAMAGRMRVETLAGLELAYPTYTAIVGLAARQLARELGMAPGAPLWHGLRPVSARPVEWERGGS